MLSDKCNYDESTTVFCHLNHGFAGKGAGQKADDYAGFYGCSSCHDLYDGRIKSAVPIEEYDELRACIATWRRLLDKAVIK